MLILNNIECFSVLLLKTIPLFLLYNGGVTIHEKYGIVNTGYPWPLRLTWRVLSLGFLLGSLFLSLRRIRGVIIIFTILITVIIFFVLTFFLLRCYFMYLLILKWLCRLLIIFRFHPLLRGRCTDISWLLMLGVVLVLILIIRIFRYFKGFNA